MTEKQSVFLPRPQKEPSFKLITLVQRMLARRWRWEELRWSVFVCCHDHVESLWRFGYVCMYVWQLYYYIRSIVRYIYDHANIGSKMGRLISLSIDALVTRTHVLLHILFLDAFSFITTVSFPQS